MKIRRYSFAQKLEEGFRYAEDDLSSFLTDFISRYCSEHPSLDASYIIRLAESISCYIIGSFNKEKCEASYKSRLEVTSFLRKAIKEGFKSHEEIPSVVRHTVYGVYMFFAGEDAAIKRSLNYGASIPEGGEWQPPAEEIMSQCKVIAKEMVVELVTKITDYAENSEYAILRRNEEMYYATLRRNEKISRKNTEINSNRNIPEAKASPQDQSFTERHPSKKQKTEPPRKFRGSFRDVDS